MAITWSSSAVERSGFDVDELLMLTADKYELAAEYRATYDPDVVADWSANLNTGEPDILYTGVQVRRYIAMHAELFATTPRADL